MSGGQAEDLIRELARDLAPVDPKFVLDSPPEIVWSECLQAMGIDPASLVPGGGETV